MSSTTTPLVTPPTVPTPTSSASPSSSPTSTTSTSTPASSTTSSPVSTSSVSTQTSTSTSSSSSSSSSSSTSVPPSTTSTAGSSTTSSTSSTTTPPTSKSSSSSTSISYLIQTSDGQVFTLTSVVTDSSPPTQPPTSGQSSNNSFFHNKGAVAGVFSVVGVVAVVLAFFLFTSFLRRRRAREFDREIDEAAAAAAAARPPDFDDYDYSSATGGYGGHYSETSHGTLSQAPLSHDQPRNPDGSYDHYAGAGVAGAAAGAAGIGARGRSLRNGGLQDPYGAFANPPEQYEMHETGRTWQQGIPNGGTGASNFDILQAAGLSSSDPYAVTRGPSTRSGLTFGQSQSGLSGLTRSQSQGTSTLPTTAEAYPMPVPTPAPVYPGGQDTAYVPNGKAQYPVSHAPGAGVSTMPPDVDEDAYGGYQEQPSGTLNNPHSPGFAGPHAGNDADDGQNVRAPYAQEPEEAPRASFADDEDYGFTVGQRVLRVANE